MGENITDDMVEYRKNYRYQNLDKLTARIECDECGGKYQVCSRNQHFKTSKHKRGTEIQELKDKIKELTQKKSDS